MAPIFDANRWAAVPFHFWSAAFFTFGSLVGSFLNVCIHRLPRGESVVTPPSHCPHCQYHIPPYLNIPLVTWLYLRGRCANCKAPISVRYFLIELLTALLFLACWLRFGHVSTGLALAYCLVLAGFIVATFIDFEHFIIPDEITIGGVVAGIVVSFLVPALHGTTSSPKSMKYAVIGAVVGAGILYAILRGGKLLFGRQRIDLAPDSRVVFTETSLQFPDHELPYDDVFYRDSDTISLRAKQLHLPDRCYFNVSVKLSPASLRIEEENFAPDQIPRMEAVTDHVILPREAMGFGDVKFMAAIGAFLGWPAVLFSLMVSSIIGAVVGLVLIGLKKQEWSSRLPYGPYIALAATLWIFVGPRLVAYIFGWKPLF